LKSKEKNFNQSGIYVKEQKKLPNFSATLTAERPQVSITEVSITVHPGMIPAHTKHDS
jgi:hypothetical protein